MGEVLHVTPDEAQDRVSSDDVLMYARWFNAQPNEFHRNDWFYATMCWLLYEMPARVWGQKTTTKQEEWLVKFTEKSPVLDDPAGVAETNYAAGMQMKKAFVSAFAEMKAAREKMKSATGLPPNFERMPKEMQAKLLERQRAELDARRARGKRPSDARRAASVQKVQVRAPDVPDVPQQPGGTRPSGPGGASPPGPDGSSV